jgi:hypothetical protein
MPDTMGAVAETGLNTIWAIGDAAVASEPWLSV